MDKARLDIAERFARLSTDKQKAFLGVLRRQGMDFARLPIVPALPSARARLSYAQARQWFLWRLDPASTAYHIPGALRLKGALDVQALRDSFSALVERHESLRTVFGEHEDGLAQQSVRPGMALDISLTEPEGSCPQTREAFVARAAARLAEAPFDLTTGPLVRAALFRMAADEHVLVVVMHHIVSDGWSMQVLVREFSAQYRACVQGTIPDLPPLPIQYADYAAWQRHWLEAGERERQLAYWQAQLGDEHPVLQLPTDRPRRADGRYQSARHLLTLPPALVQALQAQRQLHQGHDGLTLFMQLLAGFQALLHRHTGQQDIRVGVPVANRHRPETEGLIGFFVNTQVLRQVVHGRQALSEVLSSAREAVLGAQAHQDLPFEQLVEALQPERSRGASPLFQVLFNHQRGDSRAMAQHLPGLTVESHALGEQQAQFELTLSTVEDADGRVHVGLAYARELFDPDTVARMASHYVAMLEALAHQPSQAVGDVSMLDAPQRDQLDSWGGVAAPMALAPQAMPVHQMVAQHARHRPDAVAVIAGTETLSYGQLNARANRLAHWLIAHGAGPDSRVGLALERGAAMVVALLAILKAGGAYVALDTEYPSERLAYLARDSGIGLLLTQQGVDIGFVPDDLALPVWRLDQLALAPLPETDPVLDVHADALAYASYTSGSTGQPKGVLVTHGGVYRLINQPSYARLDEQVRMLQFAPVAFDASTFELWGCLAHGGVLVCAPAGKPVLDELASLIATQRVNTAFLTSALFNHLVDDHAAALTGIGRLLTGGEAMSVPHAQRALSALEKNQLVNCYGPTECTTFATFHDVTASDLREGAPPLGRPIQQTICRVLDASLNLAPPGVPGELYLGGAGLARGYLNRPGLSAERFVADPFGGDGARLYRTGDLVRWSAHGRLEYLGRLDHQVKVRGFRIELGEVEACLLALPPVREAAVLAWPAAQGGVRLVAYVSPRPGQPLDAATVREGLARSLPDYMVPGAVMVLEAFPLNANGKVDRKALPPPEIGDTAYEAPHGVVEEALAAIWSTVLGVPRVGRHDNFFALGGHSLLALKVVRMAEVSEHLSLPLSLQDMMQHPTVQALADRATRQMMPRALVALNKANDNLPPLFCIHPGYGTALAYLALAKVLNGERTVQGISCRTLNDPAFRPESLDSLADDYVDLIRHAQPRGPYHLLGWSLGGALAALVARRLERLGERVQFLGLVDTYVPGMAPSAVASEDWREDYRRFLETTAGRRLTDLVVSARVPDPLLSEEGLIEETASLLSGGALALSSQYASVSARDLVRLYVASRALQQATNRTGGQALQRLAGPARCWWARLNHKPHVPELLASQLQCTLESSFLDTDHERIMVLPELLLDVKASLARCAADMPCAEAA